jgi:hypothetical protein
MPDYETEKPKPPAEVPAFEGAAAFTLGQDCNLKHHDLKKGQVVDLTHDEYMAMRGVELYAEPVPVVEPK